MKIDVYHFVSGALFGQADMSEDTYADYRAESDYFADDGVVAYMWLTPDDLERLDLDQFDMVRFTKSSAPNNPTQI